MDELVILLNGTDRHEVNDLVESLRNSVGQLSEILIAQSEGVTVTPDFTVVISASIGLGVVTRHLAQVLVAWIRKDDIRSVKIGRLDIRGYTVEEVERLLKAYGSQHNKKNSKEETKIEAS